MAIDDKGVELAQVTTKDLTANGMATDWFRAEGDFGYSISGTFVATAILEHSFDGGTTAVPCTKGGVPVTFTQPCSEIGYQAERGLLIRWKLTAYTSGTVKARLSA